METQTSTKFSIIEMESKIIQVLRNDNTRGNTIHFRYSKMEVMDEAGCVLEIITHNVRNEQNFLLKRVTASTYFECLKQMSNYVDEEYKTEHNWTVFWTDEKNEPHQSYFRGIDEDEVRHKFFYEKHTKAIIDSIRMSPKSL